MTPSARRSPAKPSRRWDLDADGNDPRLHAARGLRGLVLARRGQWNEARPLIESALAMEAARQRTSVLTEVWRTALSGAPR